MATFTKFYPFIEALAEKKHNLGSDTLKVMLSNVAPNQTSSQKSNITEIAAGNGYIAGGEALTVTSSSQTSGTYSLVITSNIVWTASGSIGPFRYVVIYNDTATNDDLIGFYDYGSSITLNTSDTFTMNSAGATLISAS